MSETDEKLTFQGWREEFLRLGAGQELWTSDGEELVYTMPRFGPLFEYWSMGCTPEQGLERFLLEVPT